MSTVRLRQFRKEDLPGLLDAEPRFEEFLTSMNALSSQVAGILNGGVGRENLNAGSVTLEIAKSQTYPIKVRSTVRGSVQGVRVLRAVKTTNKSTGEPCGVAFHVDWSLDNGVLIIDGMPGLSATESYRVTIEMVGD